MGLALMEGDDGGLQVLTDGPEARLCAAMGVLNAATAEVVAAIAAAMADPAGWQGDGIVSPEQWVALRGGVAPARARRLVGLARRLADLPAAAAAFAVGALSEDQAQVVATHVDAAHDAEVTDLARRCTVSQLRRILPSVVPAEPAAQGEEPADAHAGPGDLPGRREMVFGFGDDGRWRARIVVAPEEGAIVEKALEASREALFRARHPDHDREDRHDTVGWCDALVHLAGSALGALEGSGRPPAERFQVVVHVEADHPERARLHLGPLLARGVGRYLSCDATGRVVLEHHGTPVQVLARRRTVDDRLRHLIEHRDQGCRVPGCGARRWLHVHHLVHWDQGGATAPDNLCCLCPAHHRMHHLGHLGIEGDPTTAEGLRFTDRRGWPIRGPSPRPPDVGPAEAAARLGLPPPRFDPPLGGRLDGRWIGWN